MDWVVKASVVGRGYIALQSRFLGILRLVRIMGVMLMWQFIPFAINDEPSSLHSAILFVTGYPAGVFCYVATGNNDRQLLYSISLVFLESC